MALTFAQIVASSVFLKCLAFLFAIYGALTFLFGEMSSLADKPGGSAHQLVCSLSFVYFSIRGTSMWFFNSKFVAVSKHDKIWGEYPSVVPMALVMFAFQVWDFSVTLILPELCKVEHVLHHIGTALVAIIALMNGPNGFCLYYAPFFIGVSEVSSMPLSAVDLFRMHEHLAAEFPVINTACRSCFLVLFISIRCVYWPYVSVDLWKSMLSSGAPKALAAFFLIGNILFTVLQCYWGCLIIKAAIEMFG